MRLRLSIAFGLAAILAAAPALSRAEDASSSAESTVPEQLQGMLADWVLEQEDQSLPKCGLTFTDTQVTGGWAIAVPDPCPAPYPAAASLAAWNIDPSDGSIVLLDATGTETLRLFEDEDGLYDTDPNVEPRFYLLPPYDEDDSGGESDSE
jgi:hypothetical protein